jgi:hypothetical protein
VVPSGWKWLRKRPCSLFASESPASLRRPVSGRLGTDWTLRRVVLPEMAKKRRRPSNRCRGCGDRRYEGEQFYRGSCETCRDKRATAGRAVTGARALAKAKDAGTVERDRADRTGSARFAMLAS